MGNCVKRMKETQPELPTISGRPHDSMDAMLAQWRCGATRVLEITVLIAFLPLLVLTLTDYGTPVTVFMKVVVLGAYVVIILGTLFWRTDYRIRARTNIASGYLLAVLGGIILPQGPFMRAVLLVLPLITMPLLGKRAGRAAGAVSVLVLMSTPVLGTMPSIVGLLKTAPVETSIPLRILWLQSLALMALLATAMVILDRFHNFLMHSLARLMDKSGKLSRAMEESKFLERELIHIADEERRRLGHEIHDGVCQQLTGVLLGVGAISRKLNREGTVAVEDLGAISALVEESIAEARGVARGLCPLNKDATALAAALHVLAKRTSEASGIPVLFKASGQVDIADSMIANHLYRIAQEALNNAVRHAHPNQINAALHGDVHALLLEVEDDGDGLPAEISNEGMGLRTMGHRASLLEGEFTVTRVQPKGTSVCCKIFRNNLNRQQEPYSEAPRDL